MNAQLVTVQTPQIVWTEEEKNHIKEYYAKGATELEWKHFMFMATERGLDPRKNQFYFIKYGNKASFVTSIDGYRLIANRTKLLNGIERGVKYNSEGKLTHGWAKVWRKDWSQPVYEEASFEEYNAKQGQWIKMPETMIKKVAESAALRMAFPDDLSGLYTQDEMEQANPQLQHSSPVPAEELEAAKNQYKKPENVPVDIETQKAMKAALGAIKDIQAEHSLSEQDIKNITGLDTFKGEPLEVLQEAVFSLVQEVNKEPKGLLDGVAYGTGV